MNIKKTRDLSKKDKFEKGLYPLSITLKKYKVNQTVVIKLRSTDLKRRPCRPFNSKIGVIAKANYKSNTYIVLVRESKKAKLKQVVTSSSHLKSLHF